MFGEYLLEYTEAKYNKRLILVDAGVEKLKEYCDYFSAEGFSVIHYEDDLSFRVDYGDYLDEPDVKLMVLAHADDYIPYDILKKCHVYEISLAKLFPRLNSDELAETNGLDLDLLCIAYRENFDDLEERRKTEVFIRDKVFGKENVSRYIDRMLNSLMAKLDTPLDCDDWIRMAESKGKIDVLSAEYRLDIDTTAINRKFQAWLLDNFGGITQAINYDTPILVSQAMNYMKDNSDKFAVIVMDGMSQFDWQIISRSFDGIKYDQTAVFAMIPTTTSVSRQCLLSNKVPQNLKEPWKQSKERTEFIACAKKLGFGDNQIAYGRGYDTEFGTVIACGAVIINDVDELVHGQKQGRRGMYNDVSELAQQGKLSAMTKKLLNQGFDVYITADHGNTPCIGMGKLKNIGLLAETKSRRMLVLRDFANKENICKRYEMIEYPRYFVDKRYDYLICDVGKSFDDKGENVMSHGGMTIDEVIVPFIKIKVENNYG